MIYVSRQITGQLTQPGQARQPGAGTSQYYLTAEGPHLTSHGHMQPVQSANREPAYTSSCFFDLSMNQSMYILESIYGSEWADDRDYWVGIFDHFIDITLYWYHEDNGHWELDNVVLFVVISGQAAVWPI